MGRHTAIWRLVAALSVVGAFAAGGVALAATAAKRHRGLSAKRVLALQSGAPVKVIVLLRNQHTNLPPTARLVSKRVAVIASAQSPLQASVTRSGGKVTQTYRTINAFAATVSKTERARLAADSAVAAVLPDAFVPTPDPTGQGTATGQVSTRTQGPAVTPAQQSADVAQQICPAPNAPPLVEPEGLSLIDADSAQQIVNGAGVKVAFLADGLDINNPDFIRPDGSHVIVDYRDFTGTGLNTPTAGAEAFGDAGTVAAQGRVTYDLSKFVNPAHPLPANCDIILRGVAPGASLYAMKVFGPSGGSFTSTILQGMDWAVSVDHVNVLNESFGSDPVPDTDQDAVKQFNDLAVATGVVVTTGTGDQGTANTIGSPASDPGAIAAGATTQFQHFAQTDRGGYQVSAHGWVNDNIAEFSSAGFTQGGRTLDLVAPGNESYSPCTANAAMYSDCTNFAGQPSNIRYFGGTSESSPMTAGVAAQVIEAYRETHGGASPSPALVKQIILSNTDDLNIPSDEQGAGELDALASVQAAESVNGGTLTGNGRLVRPSQLDLNSPAGSTTGANVSVTNVGVASEAINAHLRTLNQKLSGQHGNVTLNTTSDPTFLDQLGVSQSYTEIHFTVPSGADRLDASIAWPGPTSTVNLTLFDPSGKFSAFSYHANGETSDFSHISVRNPPAGTWTAAFFTPTAAANGAYNGAVHYDFSASRFGPVGSVTPSSVTLAPGASASLHVSLSAPAPAGDYSRDLVLSGSSGKTTVVPVVLRSTVPLGSGHGTFAGVLTGGNGNGFVGREDTFAFDVTAGEPAINVQFTLPGDPGTTVFGYLVSPDGQALGQETAVQAASRTSTLQLFERRPPAGEWHIVLLTPNPVGGTTTAAPFTGTVSLAAPVAHAVGVPNSSGTMISSGKSVNAKVIVANAGNTSMNVFIDPRRTARTLYSLLSITPATGVSLPINPATTLPPIFIVPTQSDVVYAAAQATAPVTFDWGFGDPDVESRSFGDSAVGVLSAPELTPGLWGLSPSLIGPFTSPATGTVNTGMVAHARVFDTTVSSSTGDVEYGYVNPSAPAATPVVIPPGGTAAIPVTFTAGDPKGTVVRGDLFVDDNQASDASANEIKAIPYTYKVG